MLATTKTISNLGFKTMVTSVEADLHNGLPAFIVVGLGDKSVEEAKERIRSAVKNSGLVLRPSALP